ncbi:TonB-dependent hemoglobin/transferrin/lactoferrin family receptor [Chelatococcus sp. SYSU_G07232]|uniref:TonB-dependent hemoglobin/transferrin/lactoferrin family receptor n=1 Tax=Chelatococcus albus TaxID=3047466 RepID=A0ABT7AJP7_9HYPH|nr:TonB-dependent hemoglobin/transferrin/lactoferrin family receptor [Chelatococcus sp. SYSU_G07232]MDJ1159603.1 TonB-dependent hemoglobin/transferrin/lactoferrin family receptor [Chelatococcus sp. SYSU_G07232]
MSVTARAMLLATASIFAISAAEAEPDIVLDTVTVTATKTEEKVIDTLAGASTVTREDIDRFQASRVSDVLRSVPGVTVQQNFSDPAQAVNIRGLQDFGRVNVLVDGARQNFQTSGHNANGVFYLDPEFIGGVDVVRGPVSTIYGSGAIGGVVAFRTRTIDDILAEDEKFGGAQKVGVGTNGAGFVNSTALGARLGTAADIFGQFVYRNTNTYKDGAGAKVPDSGNELVGGLVKFNVRPADGHEISASAQVQDYQFTNNGSSGSPTGTRLSHDVATGNYTLGYRFQWPDVPWLDLSLKTYYSTTNDDQTVLRPSTTYSALGVRPGAKLRFDIETYGFDVSNTARFDALGLNHAFTFGADGVRDNVDTVDAAGGYGSALTPSGTRRLTGGFVQDELRYSNWLRVIGALRFDDYKLEGGGNESSGNRLSPKITLGVTPIQGIELYATYAEGYRAPAITETLVNGLHPFPAFAIQPNPNLRPEVAHNIEGGVNIKYDNVFKDGDAFRAKATAFVNTVDDYIDIVSVGTGIPVFGPGMNPGSIIPPVAWPAYCRRRPAACVFNQQYQNIAEARLSGVELEATYDWGGGFFTLAGAHIEGKNKATDQALVSVPPNRIAGTLGLRLLDDRLTLGTRVTLVDSKTDLPSTSAIKASKAYGLVDLFASYEYSDTVRGDFVIENLFDKQYVQYRDGAASPGLTAKLGLTVKFASK